MPGQGQLIYIAGHRTTYLAPFSAIDTMRPGDRVTLAMPYGTFDYVVTGHRIVDVSDLSVLKSKGPRWSRFRRVTPGSSQPSATSPGQSP